MAKTGGTNRQRNSLPKLIDKYYADLADLARQNVFVEMGTRTAFFVLLHAAGREHRWTLINIETTAGMQLYLRANLQTILATTSGTA